MRLQPAYNARVSDPHDPDQVNRLIGETLKAMIQSGADMGAVGAFARSYPEVVARVLGAPEPTPDLDLQGLVQATVLQTMESTGKAAKKRGPKSSWVDAVKVNVVIGGKKTSATIPRSILAAVEKLAGSPKAAMVLIKETTAHIPAEVKNRSAWLTERLSSHVISIEPDPGAALRH